MRILPDPSSSETCPLGIPGAHQVSNAQLAVELYRTFLKSPAGQEHFAPPSMSTGGLTDLEKEGLAAARWPGRCQTVRSLDGSRAWFLDGAHTTESLESCAAWFVRASLGEKASGAVKRTLIFNTTHDRKSEELLSSMMEAVGKELSAQGSEAGTAADFFTNAVFCTNNTYRDGVSAGGEWQRERAARREDPSHTLRRTDLTAVAGEVSLEPQRNMQQAWAKVYPSSSSTVLSSIQEAVEAMDGEQAQHVLVCGSLHLVGGVMSHLKDAGLLDEALNGRN